MNIHEYCAGCKREIHAKVADGVIFGPYRFTRYGDRRVYCSRTCRDGADWSNLKCSVCDVRLGGKRKGARYCSDRCRKAAKHRGMAIDSTAVTDAK